ncbi:uncharacterized protein METZ01_LOCUS365282, partial [marine metagenome]
MPFASYPFGFTIKVKLTAKMRANRRKHLDFITDFHDGDLISEFIDPPG